MRSDPKLNTYLIFQSRFLGEETYHPGLQLTRSPTFVVDPIDGTTNFVHGYPYVCVSLAFVNDLVPQIGVVYNPFTGQLYHAIKNQGAFLSSISSAEDWLTLTEGGRLGSKVGKEKEKKKTRKLPFRDPPEPLEELSQAIVAVEWGNEREGNNWEVKTKTFASLAGAKAEGGAMVHSLRSLGSAELNLCAVASGTLDAYWEGGCWAWDVAAGWVVLKEAGGMMVGGNEGEWEPKVDSRRYLAVRGMEGGEEKQESFVEEFWGHVKGRLEYDV